MSKLAKHTPGPWERKRDCVRVRPEGYPRLLVEVCDVDVAPDGMRTHELPAHFLAIREANARLIAAAPELLTALEAICAEAESWHTMHGHGSVQCDGICELIPKMRAAILKATGEAA